MSHPAHGPSLSTPASETQQLSTTDTEFPPTNVRLLVEELARQLKQRKESVGVVETAAGGLISASILSVPGASGFYKGGMTLYTLESRVAFANWTPTNISSYRGPTPQIVGDLATSVLPKLKSTYVLAESGTAGPTGGTTPNRTPGYVALAVAKSDGRVWTREVTTGLGGERTANMWAFAAEGVRFLGEVVRGEVEFDGEREGKGKGEREEEGGKEEGKL